MTTNNYDLLETNELSRNAMGGTELLMNRLYDGKIPRELLQQFQIIPSRVRDLDPNRKHILYLHDLPEDPESTRLSDGFWRKRSFSKLVFVSHWQLQRYVTTRGITYAESCVIKNSIEPLNRISREKRDTIKLIYHSTPHRGLGILVPVFTKLCEEFTNIELDVFSSFGLYDWKDRDEPYEPLFQMCRDHPKIRYHGAQPNEIVRAALEDADIFAYPSIWLETSCLCLIEAMSAGLLCVHPNYGALPETSMNLTCMYQWHEDINQHAAIFHRVLRHTIQQYQDKYEAIQNDLIWQKARTDAVHNWNRNYLEWEALMNNIIQMDKYERERGQ